MPRMPSAKFVASVSGDGFIDRATLPLARRRNPFLRRSPARPLVRESFLALLLGAALIALAAQFQIRVPALTVPITLQSWAVLTVGFLLTPRQAFGAVLLYLSSGTVLMAATGHSYVFTPSSAGLVGAAGGYLAGFLVAAPVIGALGRGDRPGRWRRMVAGLAGLGIIFLMGVVWLRGFVGDWTSAIQTGLLPFLPGEAMKLGTALMLVEAWRRVGSIPARRGN